ncbi:hypothetical protein CC1G_07916 [Coprinopsis cinerea okayama7|uniref:Uncharacterized protein n=1 Tax=Coprinopsis cinerea (strain Okayama-7 / 130 / ATCC MYA-4618 / FGSC 9003) TaxID=240176 RepID=A8P6Q0_COPC7|nr:hypothetical protein CC1G_07916 [Coprinopsis cinerea okayama7\|eukprot:XP_001839201.2 hypothetical protein CC1G_07916 [Coprinopsis cinerea okayama7\
MATAEVLVQQPTPAGGATKPSIHSGGIGSRVGGLLKSKGKKPEEVKGAPSPSDGGQTSETASAVAAAAAGEVASQKSDDVPRYKRYANTAVKAFGKKGRSKEASEASKDSADAQTEAVVVVEKPAETREGEQASETAPGDAVKEADGEKPLPEPTEKETEQPTPSDDAAAMSPSSPASPAIKLARRLSHRAGNALKRSTSRTRSASDGQDDATTSPNADTAAPPVSKASLLAKQVSSRAGDLFTLKGKAGDATAKENGKDEGKDETKEDNTAAGASTSETGDAKPSESAVTDDTEPPSTSPIDKPLPHPPTLTRRLSSRVGDMVAKAKLKAADVVEHVHVHSPKSQADAATSTVSAPASEHPTRPKLTTRLSSKVGSLIKSPGGHAAAKEGEVVAVKADGSTEIKSADEAPKADDVVVVADDTKPDTPDAPKDADDRAEEPKVEEEATTADGVKVDDTKPTDETEDKAAAAPADAVEQPADAHQATGGGGIFGLASRIGGFVKSRIVSDSEAPPPLPPKEADKEKGDEGGVVEGEGEDGDKDVDKAKESEGEGEAKPAEASEDFKADAQSAIEDEIHKEPSDETKPPVDDVPTAAPPAEQAPASAPAPSPAAAAPPPAPPTSFQRTHSKTEGVQKLGRRLSARVGDVFKASLKAPKAPAPPPKDDVKGKGKEVEEGGTSAREDAEPKVEGQETPGDGAEVPKKDGTEQPDANAQPDEFVVVDNKDAPKASADESTTATTTVPATQPPASTSSSAPPSSFAKPRQTAKKIGRRLSARVGDMFKKDQAREREKEKEKEKEGAVVATPIENQVEQPAAPSEAAPQPDGEGTADDDKPQPAEDDDTATPPPSLPHAPVQASDSTEAVENHSAPSTAQDKGKGKDKLATTTTAAAAAVKDKDAALPEKPLPSKPSKSARAREAALDAKRQLSIRASELLKPKPRLDVHLAGGATSPTSPTSGDVKGKGKQKAAADKDEFVVVEGLGVDAETGVVDVTTAPQGVTVEGEPAGTSTNNDAGGGATGATATGSTSPPVTSARTRKTSVTELGRRLSTRVTGALDGLKARAHAAASSSRGSAVPPPTPPKDEPAVKDEGRQEDGAPEPVAKDEDTGTEPSAETEAATSPVNENEKTEAQATDAEAPVPPPKPTETADSEAKDPHSKRISTRVTELINKAKHKFPSDSSRRGDKEAETVDSEEWNVVEGGGESEAQVDGAAPAEGVPAATSTDGAATPNGKRKHRLSLKFRAPNLKGSKKKSAKSEGGEGSKTSSKAGSPEKELPEPSPEVPPKDEVAAGEKDGEGRKDSEDVAKEDVVKEEKGAVSQTETKDAVEENKIVNVGDDVEADAPAVPKKDTVEG